MPYILRATLSFYIVKSEIRRQKRSETYLSNFSLRNDIPTTKCSMINCLKTVLLALCNRRLAITWLASHLVTMATRRNKAINFEPALRSAIFYPVGTSCIGTRGPKQIWRTVVVHGIMDFLLMAFIYTLCFVIISYIVIAEKYDYHRTGWIGLLRRNLFSVCMTLSFLKIVPRSITRITDWFSFWKFFIAAERLLFRSILFHTSVLPFRCLQ